MTTPFQPVLPEATLRAMARWPDVPAVHGWLRLDRRARWFVRDGEVTHPGALAFLNANYGSDAEGRWFVQNGPQRAFVDLDLAPWVLKLAADGTLYTHAGRPLERIQTLVPTAEGDLCVESELGLGSVLDRDLPAFLEILSARAPGSDVPALLLGETPGVLALGTQTVAVLPMAAGELPARFGYTLSPRVA